MYETAFTKIYSETKVCDGVALTGHAISHRDILGIRGRPGHSSKHDAETEGWFEP
jgi:hypothetical protein